MLHSLIHHDNDEIYSRAWSGWNLQQYPVYDDNEAENEDYILKHEKRARELRYMKRTRKQSREERDKAMV
jgi:hypothetical protein